MTRKEALTDLLARVEAGHDLSAGEMEDASLRAGLDPKSTIDMIVVYRGSLDAAKALHEAVLPGCSQYSIVTDPTCLKVSVCWWPEGLYMGNELYGDAWSGDNPARAWLTAILKALIAECDE